MATYASTTNPFIEPNATPASSPPNSSKLLLANQEAPQGDDQTESRGQFRKNIPGMARPSKSIKELSNLADRSDLESILLDQEVVCLSESNNKTSTKLQSSDADKSNVPISTSLVDEDVEFEIKRTCASLVESAAKLSVQDEPPILDENNNQQPFVNEAQGVTPLDDPASSSTSSALNCHPEQDTTKVFPSSFDSGKQRGSKCNPYLEDEDDEDDDVVANLTECSSDKSKLQQVDFTKRQQQQHIELMKKLRLQLRDLERYAYERGELEHVPPSILAERQSVILDKLRKRLSLNLDKDKIEKLELEELKRQVDEEINALMDPLITKENLLNQLKTQLTDLERYISHLHGAIGKNASDRSAECSCSLHGCSSSISSSASSLASSTHSHSSTANNDRSLLNSDTLPKTSRLIRGLMAQLICSDMKIQEAMKLEDEFVRQKSSKSNSSRDLDRKTRSPGPSITTKPPQFHDGAAWTLHIDRVILATDSLTNLFSMTPKRRQKDGTLIQQAGVGQQHQVDETLVEPVVRRQLVPAIRDILAYGLIDPSSLPPKSNYMSFLIDPYYLFTSFSCLPGSQTKSDSTSEQAKLPAEKVHVWNLIEDYYESKKEVNFKTSSVKTLSQSFNLTTSMEGPIKITSKQALFIATDDIITKLAKRKPNGPESHLRLFIYTALNQGKLATWIKIIFRNKSILRKYYHDFSFVCQTEKMDKFLATIESLSQFAFNIDTDTDSKDQFVSAF